MNSQRFRKMIDEPAMSDKTLLVTVEDLIYTTFGAFSENRVNFKLLQTVLHILARQLRLLEQDVEIKFDDIGIDFSREQAYYSDGSGSYSSSYSSGEEGEGGTGRKKRREGKEEREKRKAKREKGAKKGEDHDREGKGGSRGSRDHDGRGKERDGRSRGRRGGQDDEDERGGGRRDAGRQLSGTSITVSEIARRGEGGGADKVLVAERGPASHDQEEEEKLGSK